MLELNKTHRMNCLDGMGQLPKGSIDCCVTSPAYWSMRDYGIDPVKWPDGWIGCLGLESDFRKYIGHVCDVFDQVKRVLKKTGTLWVNIGDSYATNGDQSRRKDSADNTYRGRSVRMRSITRDLPSKSLMLIPARFAIEMCERGWILRNTIIWHKTNPIPNTAADRFTIDFEYMFFFVKSKSYYFNEQFEPQSMNTHSRGRNPKPTKRMTETRQRRDGRQAWVNFESRKRWLPKGRRKRTVWSMAVGHSSGPHFATFPRELIRTPIAAGCPPGGVVLDPFMGSGRTAQEALYQGKRYVGFEMSEEYHAFAEKELEPYRQQRKMDQYA